LEAYLGGLVGQTVTFQNEFSVTYLTVNKVSGFVAVIVDQQEVRKK